MYLDAGFDRTAAFIEGLFAPLIREDTATSLYRDYKTDAQEICQVLFREVPRYTLIAETGPDHDKRFVMSLGVGDRVIATGTGRNKKEAEQQAAKIALGELRQSLPPGEKER
jgi:ribonuclease III